MRAAVIAVALGSLLAVGLPEARADEPAATIVCVVNSLFISPPVVRALDCLEDAADDSPLCLQLFDRGTGTLKSYPCAAPCVATPAPGWLVGVSVQGSPGDQVTGALRCGGATAVGTTATVTALGEGAGFTTGPIPNDGSAMTCGLDGALPPTVDAYVVVCAPDP